MAALRRVRIYWENPPTGAFEVEYEDTKRPNRRVFETYGPRGMVTVTEAARITSIPRRTLYYWIEEGHLDHSLTTEGHFQIPLSEIRRLLEEEEEEDAD